MPGFRPLIIASSVALLSGCALVMEPITGAISLAGSMVTSVSSMGPTGSTTVSVSPHPALHALCIEWNQNVSVQDFIPELQNQLRSRQIDSKVYDKGMAPSECEAVLYYTVQIRWDTPTFQDDQQPYISGINLLLKSRGRMIANATYGMDSSNTQNRWASTGKKLEPLIDGMFGKVGQAQPETPAARTVSTAPAVTRDVWATFPGSGGRSTFTRN